MNANIESFAIEIALTAAKQFTQHQLAIQPGSVKLTANNRGFAVPMSPDRPELASPASLEYLQLSMKAYGFLRRSQIHSVADLLDYTQEDLLLLDEASGQEVIAALQQQFNLTLPQE